MQHNIRNIFYDALLQLILTVLQKTFVFFVCVLGFRILTKFVMKEVESDTAWLGVTNTTACMILFTNMDYNPKENKHFILNGEHKLYVFGYIDSGF